jgi:hypothetical protein
MMAETIQPYFATDADTSHEAKEALNSFQDGAAMDPNTYEAAIDFYSTHPEAARALLQLVGVYPTAVTAIQDTHTIIENGYDKEADVDPLTKHTLETDPMFKRYRSLVESKKGEEREFYKAKLRNYRLKTLVQGFMPDSVEVISDK